jgi:hypothetical protein
MNTSKIPSESAVNDALNKLVDELDEDKRDGGLRMFEDGMFDIDARPDTDVRFDFGEPERAADDENRIVYV